MKNVLVILCFNIACFAFAQKESNLHSPFKSTYPGITIPNTHLVETASGTVLRGEQPGSKVSELVKAGVTDILIFKNPTQTEVDDELSVLKKEGFTRSHIINIPFRWKAFPDLNEACAQTLEGLKILQTVANTKGRSIYFHCTVGEDRTGYLAGLYRILMDGWSLKKTWTSEMCGHGYGAGDPKKPKAVSDAINGELTPLFLKMVTLIEEGKITSENLDDVSVCNLAHVRSHYQADAFACSPVKP